MAEKKITTIPATLNKFTSTPINSKKKRRVAGYARVSTDQEEQQTSYQAQVDYYTNYIKSRSDWEFAGLYADDEITDTIIHSVEEDDCCPNCGCDKLIPTEEYEEKDEIDYKVIVTKTRHKYAIHRCECCGQKVRTGILPNHRAECQYGANVQAICLSLMNTTNAAINKVPMLIEGLTKGEVCPSTARSSA